MTNGSNHGRDQKGQPPSESAKREGESKQHAPAANTGRGDGKSNSRTE